MLTDDETLVLMMALISNGPLKTSDLVLGLGSRAAHGYYIASRLRLLGALDKPRYGEWTITEKGRIACALAMHKDPSLYDAFFG